mmetsp:Transcript_63409/g.151525  ORF Transcript_63409/g.151525 Transcript_63409/m.151525 type:complete len:218 (+) Transcript_63409:105-758(+)
MGTWIHSSIVKFHDSKRRPRDMELVWTADRQFSVVATSATFTAWARCHASTVVPTRPVLHPALLQLGAQSLRGVLLFFGDLVQQVIQAFHPDDARAVRKAAVQLVRRLDNLNRLEGLVQLEATADQHRVELLVRVAAFFDHRLVHAQRPLKAPVLEAGVDQAGVDLDVGLQAVLCAQILHHLHGLAQAPGVPKQLHQDAQRVVAGPDPGGLHLLEHP